MMETQKANNSLEVVIKKSEFWIDHSEYMGSQTAELRKGPREDPSIEEVKVFPLHKYLINVLSPRNRAGAFRDQR